MAIHRKQRDPELALCEGAPVEKAVRGSMEPAN
jgi:hypothetical protein